MTRRANARSIALAAALAGLTLALCTGAALAQKPRAERPTYKIGDKWLLASGSCQLTRIERDVYIFSAGRGNEIHLTKDLGIAKVMRDGKVEWEVDAPMQLTWPLEVRGDGPSRASRSAREI